MRRIKRILVVALALLGVLFSVCSLPAVAAVVDNSTTQLTSKGLTVTADNSSYGSCTISEEAGVYTIKYTAKGYKTLGIFKKKSTTKITIENTSKYTISFDVRVGSKTAAATTYSGTPGTSWQNWKVDSPEGSGENTAYIYISNIVLDLGAAEVTVKPTEGLGTLVVNNYRAKDSEGNDKVDASDNPIYETDENANFLYTAKPSENYKFFGFKKNDGTYIVDAGGSFQIEESITLQPVFVKSDSATFATGGCSYPYLDVALEVAASGDKKVTVVSSGLAYGKSTQKFTIPNGVTLLVPCSSSDVGAVGQSGATSSSGTRTTAYCTLTLPSDSSISVAGVLNVNAVQGRVSTAYQGNIYKTFGQLNMLSNSTIEVVSNGTLYARGLIQGDGHITAKSDAKVYQLTEITDWRGGSYSSDLFSKTPKIFPFNQIYIQNIQVVTEYFAGAKLYGTACLYASSTLKSVDILLIGTSDETALFCIKSGSLLFGYDSANAKTKVTVNGVVAAEAITLEVEFIPFVLVVDINSADAICPLSGAFDINILDGATMNIKQAFKILPDCTIMIEDGGTMNIADAGSLYLYDADDFPYSSGDYIYRKWPSTSETKTGAIPTTHKDGTLIVNGTLNVYGGLYASANSGNSHSIRTTNDTGVINYYATTVPADCNVSEAISTKDPTSSVAFKAAAGHQVDCCMGQCSTCASGEACGSCVWTVLSAATTYYSNGSAWYTHRVDYYEGASADTAVLIPSLTIYSVGGFPEGANAVKYEHDAKLFTGLTSHADTWSDFEAKYEYNDADNTDQFVQAYYRVCNAKLLVYDQKGGAENALTLEYRLNDYIWLNASGYLDFDSATFDKSKLTVSGDCELLVVGNVVYIVRRVVAKELPETMTITLAYDGIPSAPFTVDFGTYKTLLEGKDTTSVATKTLLAAMMTYGKAAANYFSSGSYEISAGLNMDQSQDVSSGWTAGATSGTSTISTKSAKIYFDEALRMSVYFAPTGIDTAQIKQIGLLVSTSSGVLEGSTAPATYVIYNILEDVEINPGGIGNYPTGNTGLAATILDYTELPTLDEKGRWEVCFDLSAGTYLKSFELRPYVLLADGSYIYGEQVHYSLAAYISRMYEKSSDLKFKNLLAATWKYAVAADEAF